MKSIYIAFIIALAIPMNNEAQTIYNLEVKDKNGNLLLLGKSTRERLQQAPYDSWFNTTYNDYLIDSATANQLKSMLKGKRFQIFMGTWCGDSRREVPRIYKLLDYCGIPASQIELINVDYHDSAYKQSPTHEERGLQIHRVPNLLVYEKNKELGRVVESPVTTWEKDLLAILQQQAYVPKYKGVPHLAAQFQSKTVKEMEAGMQQMADQLRPLVPNRFELQSYANIQFSLKDMEKALFILRLNTLLFPNEAAVWTSLTDACLKYHNAAR
jgi:hypothetical protein